MSDHTRTLNFRAIAKQIAESHSRQWNTPKVLDLLFAAFWRGEFEPDGQPKATLESWHSPDTPPLIASREFVVRLLPTGAGWVPAAVRRADRTKADLSLFPWAELAGLPFDDYDPTWRRNTMEYITIDRSDYVAPARKARLPMPKAWQVSGDDSSWHAKRAPGRPGAKHLYLREYRRRFSTAQANENIQAEARYLVKWLRTHHPEVHAPKPSTIAKVLYGECSASVGNSR